MRTHQEISNLIDELAPEIHPIQKMAISMMLIALDGLEEISRESGVQISELSSEEILGWMLTKKPPQGEAAKN